MLHSQTALNPEYLRLLIALVLPSLVLKTKSLNKYGIALFKACMATEKLLLFAFERVEVVHMR